MNKSLPEQVERGLADLRREQPEPFHFEQTLANARSRIKRRNPVMSAFKHTAIGFGAVAVFIFAMILIPASYTVEVGSIVTISVPTAANLDKAELIQYMNALENTSQVNFNESPEELQLMMAFKETKSKAAEQAVRKTFAPLMKTTPDMTINSQGVYKKVGGNALAAITGGIVHVNASGLSDAEIEAAIVAECQKQFPGTFQVDVQSVTANGETEKTINIEWEYDSTQANGQEQTMEFYITSDGVQQK